jgi:hypothetical protein
MKHPRFLFMCMVCLLVLSGTGRLSAQDRNIFLELGGSGGLASVNYERTIGTFMRLSPEHGQTQEELTQLVAPHRFSWRVGFGTTPIDQNNGWVLVFPVMIHYSTGANHQFVAGAGIAPSVTTRGAGFIRSPLLFGYRYMGPLKPVYFMIGYTPLISWLVDFQWQHWAGVSIGYRLGEL